MLLPSSSVQHCIARISDNRTGFISLHQGNLLALRIAAGLENRSVSDLLHAQHIFNA
jgi:hypothetical protein